jgi:hypothetical protein
MKACPAQEQVPAGTRGHQSSGWPVSGELTDLASRGLLPLDLREWFAADTLLAWSSAETALLDPDEPRLAEGVLPPGAPEPRVMLTMLCYAYICGLFDSDEIVRACHTQPHFELLGEGGLPFARDIALFRHRSRTLLVPVLVHLLERAVRERFGLHNSGFTPSIRRALQENAQRRLDTARHMDRGSEA